MIRFLSPSWDSCVLTNVEFNLLFHVLLVKISLDFGGVASKVGGVTLRYFLSTEIVITAALDISVVILINEG